MTDAVETPETEAEETAPKAKSKYEVMHCGIGKSYKDEHTSLIKLADTLGCNHAALVWEAVRRLLADPPTIAPEGATSRTGSASGWWVVADQDDNGRAYGVRIVEVASRGAISGQTFYRYDKDDEKSQGRAERQAQKAAAHLASLVGIDASEVTSEPLVAGAAAVA